jgi:hypothetical protein
MKKEPLMTDLSSEIDMDEFTGPKPADDKP